MTKDMQWTYYQQMYTIRGVEERLLSLYTQGVLFGTVHTCIGQEACAVGVVNALDRKKDIIWSNHRGHGHFLAYCDDIEGLIAEIMGKASGVCGGIGGSQHIHKENFYTNGVLGGTIPCAVGTALAEKCNGSDAIAAAFLGDGALGEGIVYESFNIASLWNLPVLFVLEHNQYAQTTPTHMAHAGDITRRAEAFDIESNSLDADDVNEVHKAALQAVQTVRHEKRPFFLSLLTYRFAPHSKGDDFRSIEEINTQRKKDPIMKLRNRLETLDSQRLLELEHEIVQRVDESVEEAIQAPFPLAESFLNR
jgi:acetoin:2,6-dichlorophenolindophenol oxidoreductase subunit alpha